MYSGSNRSGEIQVWNTPPTGEGMQQVTRSGELEAFESPGGRTLFWTKVESQTPGLWGMPVGGGDEAPHLELWSLRLGWWGVSVRGIFFVDFSAVRADRHRPVKVRTADRARISGMPPRRQSNGRQRLHGLGGRPLDRLETGGTCRIQFEAD